MQISRSVVTVVTSGTSDIQYFENNLVFGALKPWCFRDQKDTGYTVS